MIHDNLSAFCDLGEYNRVFRERLRADELPDAQVLTAYFRLESGELAVKQPVYIEKWQSLARLAVDIWAVNEELTQVPGVVCSGFMINSIWNAPRRPEGFGCYDVSNGRMIPAYDGIFMRPADDSDLARRSTQTLRAA